MDPTSHQAGAVAILVNQREWEGFSGESQKTCWTNSKRAVTLTSVFSSEPEKGTNSTYGEGEISVPFFPPPPVYK